ncbi:MAG: type II secretion system protein M, partial [Simplicispira sp.]|nr:type II secretion system protein M [Simplicispira sp.]
MQALQTQAQQLKDAPRADPDTALRALQTSVTEHLGASARLAVAGDRATLTLQGTPASALATWLVQARSNAHSVPQEAHLVRSTPAPAAHATTGPSTPARAHWDGQLVLALPPR